MCCMRDARPQVVRGFLLYTSLKVLGNLLGSFQPHHQSCSWCVKLYWLHLTQTLIKERCSSPVAMFLSSSLCCPHDSSQVEQSSQNVRFETLDNPSNYTALDKIHRDSIFCRWDMCPANRCPPDQRMTLRALPPNLGLGFHMFSLLSVLKWLLLPLPCLSEGFGMRDVSGTPAPGPCACTCPRAARFG
jgi:hypothetical protein